MLTQTTDNKALLAVAAVETETASTTAVVAAAVAVETRVVDQVVADNQIGVVDEVVAAAADVVVGEPGHVALTSPVQFVLTKCRCRHGHGDHHVDRHRRRRSHAW
jgi:hypothetical protein